MNLMVTRVFLLTALASQAYAVDKQEEEDFKSQDTARSAAVQALSLPKQFSDFMPDEDLAKNEDLFKELHQKEQIEKVPVYYMRAIDNSSCNKADAYVRKHFDLFQKMREDDLKEVEEEIKRLDAHYPQTPDTPDGRLTLKEKKMKAVEEEILKMKVAAYKDALIRYNAAIEWCVRKGTVLTKIREDE